MEREVEHEQGYNRTQNHYESHRVPFVLPLASLARQAV